MMLIDLRIPDMRGDVVYHLAISLQPHLRCQSLFMTGDVTEQAAELIEACACPLLMKPFDLKDLSEAVDVMVARSEYSPYFLAERVQQRQAAIAGMWPSATAATLLEW